MRSRPEVRALERHGALALLGLAVLAAAVLLLALDSHLTFFADDWALLFHKRGWSADTFLEPYVEHFILAPVLVFKLLQETFGMSSAMPYYVVSVGLYLATAVLLFFYLRPRVGEWLALIGAVLILFLGAAFEDTLWISPLNFSGSMVAGLGMLLALDRDDVRGDRVACGLLVVSITFSSVGLAFAVGALVDVLMRRRPRAPRAFVVAVPIALYALWWIGWGHNARTQANLDTLTGLPGFVADSAAAGFTSLLGLATGNGSEPSQPHLIWGRIVLVAVTALVVARVVRLRRVPRGLAVVLAIALAFWVSTGILPNAHGEIQHAPTSSRYQLMSAVFLLLIVGETIRGLRIPARAIAVTGLVAAIASVAGVLFLHREYEGFWRTVAADTRADLGALEIAGTSADPNYVFKFPPALKVTAGTYLATVHSYGSPAYDEAQIEASSPEARAGADETLVGALGIALVATGSSTGGGGCEVVVASPAGETGATLERGAYTLENRSRLRVDVSLGRFASGVPVGLGVMAPGTRTALRIPADRSSRPWRLGLVGAGPIRLCRAGSKSS